MRRTPLVLGILSMSLGALATLTSLGGLVGRRALQEGILAFGDALGRLPRGAGQPSPVDSMRRALEAQESVAGYQRAMSIGLAVLSVVLIFIGVGLYRRRAWARQAAIGWAIAALAFLPVMAWLQYVIQSAVLAATLANLTALPSTGTAARTFASFQLALSVVGIVGFYTPFPAILLGFMVRKSAKADFA